jgi:hypothetical protein
MRAMRDTVFISHANPEDNDFTRWLALQLTNEGYQVWTDLTNLLGGEDIWKNAENIIRERCAKFIFVLSRTSNCKNGTLQELQTADNVTRKEDFKNFIVPLIVDDLPYTEMNIQISRLNAIPFNNGNWAIGLKVLLELFNRENVPKGSNSNSSNVSDWWRNNYDSTNLIIKESEDHLSNWFLIEEYPEKINFYSLRNHNVGPISNEIDFTYPVYRENNVLFTFADKNTIKSNIPDPYYIDESLEFSLDEFISGKNRKIFKGTARNIVTNLLNEGWLRYLQKRGLIGYELSNRKLGFFYTKDIIPNGKVKYINAFGKNTTRKLIGGIGINKIAQPGKENSIKYWHFCIGVKPMLYPEFAYCVYPHVLFSDDGLNIWGDKKKLHKARRRFCSRWWNAEWRDRTLAFVSSLSGGEKFINIEMGAHASLKICLEPIRFRSQITYKTPAKTKIDKEHIAEYFEDEDVEEGAE